MSVIGPVQSQYHETYDQGSVGTHIRRGGSTYIMLLEIY